MSSRWKDCNNTFVGYLTGETTEEEGVEEEEYCDEGGGGGGSGLSMKTAGLTGGYQNHAVYLKPDCKQERNKETKKQID